MSMQTSRPVTLAHSQMISLPRCARIVGNGNLLIGRSSVDKESMPTTITVKMSYIRLTTDH